MRLQSMGSQRVGHDLAIKQQQGERNVLHLCEKAYGKGAEQVDLCFSRWSIRRRRRAEASRGHLCGTRLCVGTPWSDGGSVCRQWFKRLVARLRALRAEVGECESD